MRQILTAPIFVVGHSRSGTTLLATILGRNSALAMPPETQFFIENSAMKGHRLGMADMEQILNSRRIADLHLEPQAVMRKFAATDGSLSSAFAVLIDAYREKVGKTRAGEKSPLHLHHAETMIDAFPDSRMICIERNGPDVISSLMRMPWSHRNVARHAFNWRNSIERARWLAKRYPDQFLRVSFAELTEQPEKVVKEVCRFCDLSYESEMIEESNAATIPSWERDWKQAAAGKIVPVEGKGLAAFSWLQRAVFLTVARDASCNIGMPIAKPSPLQSIAGWARSWPYHPRVHPHLQRMRASFTRSSK